MAPKNVKALGDICMVFEAFGKFLDLQKSVSAGGQIALDVIQVLVATDLYSFEFGKLSSFFDKADLVKKLNGYVESQAVKEGLKKPEFAARTILNHLREFVRVLSLHPDDGKFLIKDGGGSIEYVCLNPGLTMKRLLDGAHKVILASGTLEPTSEYDVLKQFYSDDRFLKSYSCNHLLPPSSFLPRILSSSFDSHKFDFRFANQ